MNPVLQTLREHRTYRQFDPAHQIPAEQVQAMPVEGQQAFHNMVRTIYPLQRIGRIEDIGQAAVFLASAAAGWITGTVLAVDGGLTTN